MAVAVIGGHVNRALEFLKHADNGDMYFAIGGTKSWEGDTVPAPDVDEHQLIDIIGLKKVSRAFLVVETDNASESAVTYRNKYWKRVSNVPQSADIEVDLSVGDGTSRAWVPADSSYTPIVGDRVFIESPFYQISYFTKIVSVSPDSVRPGYTEFTLESNSLLSGAAHEGTVSHSAYTEGAKHVFVECYLEYDRFPVASYRQIGLYTGVAAASGTHPDTILSNDWESLGTLEVLDNRQVMNRDENQREHISLIIEF